MVNPIVCLTEVEWRNVGEEDTAEQHWIRNLTCPSVGEVRWVRLIPPDDFPRVSRRQVSQRRWLLFEPNYASWNGFDQDENPQDLDLCAVVEVELLQVFLPVAPTQYEVPRSWAQCHCLRVVTLANIPHVFPPMPIVSNFPPNNLATVFGENLAYFETQTIEVRDWYIVARDHDSQLGSGRLILSGFSIDSYCYICNWPVQYDKTSWRTF